MVNDLINVIAVIEAEYGPLSLFAILKMDDVADRWSLAVAAQWIDDLKSETKRDAIFDRIFDQIATELTQTDAESIVRIGLLSLNSHLGQGLVEYTNKIQDDFVEIRDKQINGNTIHHGIIFRTNLFAETEFVSTITN